MAKNRLKYALILVITLFLNYNDSFSQHLNRPVSSQDAFDEIDRIYSADQRLISGKIYREASGNSNNEHPFCIDQHWKRGNVSFEDASFDSLLLKFDILSNQIVLNLQELNNMPFSICLDTREITEFQIEDKRFIKYSDSTSRNENFYEIIVEGEIDYILFRSKEQILIEGDSRNRRYKESLSEYLVINDNLVKFRSPKTLYSIFPELKASLQEFISSESISGGTTELASNAKLVSYCNYLLSISE